jgi:hypothetical protein
MRLTKSGPPAPKHPDILFMHQSDVMTHARLLAEHRGHQRFEHRWPALENSLRIFDQYALAYKTSRGLAPKAPIGASWEALAEEPTVQDIFSEMLKIGDGQSRFREIEYDLPVESVDIPSRGAPASVMGGSRPSGKYRLDELSPAEFVSMCWQVRSNLEHGGYDLNDRSTQGLLMSFSRPLTCIVWRMLCRTQR